MAVFPAAALAAGEESPEAAEGTAPASTGWVPQGSGSESSGAGSTGVRHGSSLGRGASPNQTQPASQEASYAPPPASSSELESPAPASEEPASAVSPASGTSVVKESVITPPVVKPAPVGLGAATQVSAAESTPVAEASAKPSNPLPVKLVAASHDQASSGSTVLPLFAMIVCGLILVCAGTKLVLGPVEPLRRYRSTGPV
jgi:hypothetical protein